MDNHIEGDTRYSQLPICFPISTPFVSYGPASYGLLTFAKDTRRWFMVKRRHSNSLINLLWGRYRSSSIPSLVADLSFDEISLIERSLVEFDDYTSIVRSVYNNKTDGRVYAYQRFRDLRKLFMHAIEMRFNGDLTKVHTFPDIDWFWAKGQKDSKFETSLDTAIREFEEESGITISEMSYVMSRDSIMYEFEVSPALILTVQLWVCIVDNETEPPSLTEEDIEISERGWMDTQQVLEHLSDVFHREFFEAEELVDLSLIHI